MSETSGRPRHLPEISDEHWDAFNSIRNKHEVTWADTFKRFSNYQDWVEHLFKLPGESSNEDKINAVTASSLLPEWLNNVHNNFLDDINIPDISTLAGTSEKPGLVIGAGPSLIERKHLNALAGSKFYNRHEGVIISTAHSLVWCLEAGVIPDYVTMIDADKKMVDFFDNPLVEKYSKKLTGLFSITVDRDVFDHWDGEKLFFVPVIPHMATPNVQSVLSMLLKNTTVIDCMANCGSFSWNIARYIGCNQIALIGMDFSFKPDFPVKDTPYYEPLRALCSSEKEMVEKWYRFHTHSFFGTNCYTDYIHDSFCTGSTSIFKAYKERFDVNTINCTEGGIIDEPDVIENMYFADWLKQFED